MNVSGAEMEPLISVNVHAFHAGDSGFNPPHLQRGQRKTETEETLATTINNTESDAPIIGFDIRQIPMFLYPSHPHCV